MGNELQKNHDKSLWRWKTGHQGNFTFSGNTNARPESRRISRRKPAKKLRLAAEKNAANRNPVETKPRLGRRKIGLR